MTETKTDRLKKLCQNIIKNMDNDPKTLDVMEKKLVEITGKSKRKRITYDTIDLYKILGSGGEFLLYETLNVMDTDRLKNIIRTYSMDNSKKYTKWDKDRLVKLIVEKIIVSNGRGDVFLTYHC